MMSQQQKPPSGLNAFMDKAGWSTVAIAVGTAIASIATLWAGTLHILNFDWIILLLALIMVAVTIYFVWYSIRTRIILQEQYQQYITDIRKELQKFQDDLTQRVNQEIKRWNESAITYSQTNAKEQAEHLQDAKNELKKDIAEAKTELTEAIHQDYMNWNKWVHDHAGAHEQQKKEQNEQLEEVKKQLDESIEEVNRNLSTRIQNYWKNTTEWENAHNVAHGKE